MFSENISVYQTIEELGKSTNRPVFLAMGMFDGVHSGHQEVLSRCKRLARKSSGKAIAFTFPKHPASYLRPGNAPPLLMNEKQKVDCLLEYGMDGVVLRNFDREFADVEAKHFPVFLIARIPSLTGLCVGENFRFGKDRIGDHKLLSQFGKEVGLTVEIVSSKLFTNMTISSSRIREALKNGSIEEVNKLLGAKYTISGLPIRGKGIGKEIGFPTINLEWEPEAKPNYGVYLGFVTDQKLGEKHYAIANYGMRPTVELDASRPLFEIHVLDQIDSLFASEGNTITMTLHKFLREEKRFNSLDELKKQIKLDLIEAEKLRSNI